LTAARLPTAFQGARVGPSVLRPVVLSSVSLFHDLTGLDLAYQVAAVGHSEGQVTDGQRTLRAGSRTITTSGLEFIPFTFEPLQLAAGNSYHIQFSFDGNGNQNLFHNNCATIQQDNPFTCVGNQAPYSVGPFTNVDGTHAGHTANFVQPAVIVEAAETAPIPEPGTMLLFAGGAAAAGARRLRIRQLKPRKTAIV